MAPIGSKPPAFTSPAVAITIAGAPFSALSASSSAVRSMRPTASLLNTRTTSWPIPSMLSAFFAEAWMKPLVSTGTAGKPLIPRSAMFAACSSPHHWRAAATAVKFDIVAPVVKTPPQPVGRRKRSFSQPMATCSSLEPSGALIHNPALLSRAEASQSAASAAGVEPPVTKWKKRGPAELVAASMPSVRRLVSVARLPFPSSGSSPTKRWVASSRPALPPAGSSSTRAR